MNFIEIVDALGTVVDGVGVAVIIVGGLVTGVRFLGRMLRKADGAYRALRENLGRSILIGLEFLVAGDIIKTIVVTPNGQNVAALAGIVAIRTFLSVSLTVEMTGRWPWQRD
ncbi:DUF1622 domain-containing protein [Mycobacterium angelicum]|uniref:DUF1622 domain-containing protein n=1 Tax=Mycobacterium angelicum TaxID=470074 RepID=A0A1W9ZU15_MYCAN|nr:DUF1622 domain-containing protein [Mycobacterium angelicum]MCV7195848.1 DUF1622 domain-containing protein [Mycobacterium angelicum]ORA21280.1 hypothetical protein BST12_12935 [Mycobacterium angelicum]